MDWDYLFKCDDDTYVSVERLLDMELHDADYIGQPPGALYASGGAGYFLSRRAVSIIDDTLTHSTGAEDVLVAQVLNAAGIELKVDERFVPFGDEENRPRSNNALITTHAVSSATFERCHQEVGGTWPFRIVIPTSNAYAATVLPIAIHLLNRYWPDHPPVDVVHYDTTPPEIERVRAFFLGPQASVSWSTALALYLERHNADHLVLLMLDDYGLCGRVERVGLRAVVRTMLSDPKIGNVHLTWQPIGPKSPRGDVLQLPRWAYSINTQAAVWRRDLLLDALQHEASAAIEDFELKGSAWFNQYRFDTDAHCQALIPEPEAPSAFVDETDKTSWIVPYHNLMRRGTADVRHTAFLADHGLRLF